MELINAYGILKCFHCIVHGSKAWSGWLMVCVSISESIELFIEDQAFSPLYAWAPPPPPALPATSTGDAQEDWERETNYWREGMKRWGRSKIIRKWESLVLYKSFNTLWSTTAELETIMIPRTGSHACISSFQGHFALIWNDLKARFVQIVPVYYCSPTGMYVHYSSAVSLFYVKYVHVIGGDSDWTSSHILVK